MSIIMISRGAHHRGKEVAEKIALMLGYECLSRDILLEASRKYDVREVKFKKSMERAPNFFEKLGFEKEKYISYMQSALLNRLKKDYIVYHGLAGYLFVQNVSHAFSVRVVVDIKDRVKYCMQSEGVSEEKAYAMLHKLDEQRKKWGQYLHGVDISDPDLYDMVININRLTVDEAADIICSTAGLEKYQTTAESRQKIEDLALEAEVTAVLINVQPPKDVSAHNGVVSVQVQGGMFADDKIAGVVEELSKTIEGVKEVRTEVLPYIQPFE
ncbi:MAG: cytidylate kinase-like family protein [Desulfobacteraceae bacterium]|nr:cytidylate kinase-like family protein [Desulfobacteraceae bacterium]MBC2757980.1 cytidylate kinase-like family protein [Desulfobacteraceae bacterium]